MSGNSRHFLRQQGPTQTEAAAEAFIESEQRISGAKGPTRIMYIEEKSGNLLGPARIGRVSFSKSRSTLYYRGLKLQSLKGAGFKSNYFDVETGTDFWISGPKCNGEDALYGGGGAEIDEDCREEYWLNIRERPDLLDKSVT